MSTGCTGDGGRADKAGRADESGDARVAGGQLAVAGEDLPVREFGPIRAGDMATIAALLADPNPLHFDHAAVRAAGLGDRLVNQGPANMAYLSAMLEARFGAGSVRRLALRFARPVREGDHVLAGGRVTAVVPDLVECEVWLDVPGVGRAASGTAAVAAGTRRTPRT